MGIIENLTSNFSLSNLDQFFRNKIHSFRPDDDNYDYLFEDVESIQDFFTDIQKLGEADLPNGEDLFVFTAHTKFSLTDRSSKKQQYDIAKKLLKEEVKDAAFFIFYDKADQFRFSFIRADFKGTKRDYTTFKRFTYFVSPEQTNQTFIRQLSACNFQDLEEIQTAFSVEPLNKEFYQKIAKAFYQLIGGKVSEGSKAKEYIASLKLPSLDSKKNHRTYQEFAVRFIGRTIFIWFLKNKTSDAGLPLIPSDWLSSGKVGATKDYYHSLLEKLFFEILNTPIEDRINSLPDEHITIPFLNGGLFEPQHDDFYEAAFNGFSKHHNTLKIPDAWILELFETLEQFNFTIDENTLTDMEVSIDPEMLGTIFENLLAEIDPDTEKSARKSTGSFYTPRKIVDYMVTESFIAYLETKTSLGSEVLRSLFIDGEMDIDCGENREQLIEAFDTIKILDPACGSGAFPMGALHKINLALQKLDPDAEVWKERQLAKIENVAYRNALKDKLDKSNVDYVRKIGIIQHSIYGVDIQPIATEISKLRSFLSLVVDENIDDSAPNRGIYPLPNLEFKFITANTLVSLKGDSSQNPSLAGSGFDFSGVNKDIESLRSIRDQYLQSFGDEKVKLKSHFINIQKQIAQKEFSSGSYGGNKAAQQIVNWAPFSHAKSNWFSPHWMFGVKEFDIIIGNPPYGAKFSLEEKGYFKDNYQHQNYQPESYLFFTERSFDFLKESGVLAFIIPNTWLTNLRLVNIRKFLTGSNLILNISHYHKNVFDAVVDTEVVMFKKGYTPRNRVSVYRHLDKNKVISLRQDQDMWKEKRGDVINIFATEEIERVIAKINTDSKQLLLCADIYAGVKPYEKGKGKPAQTKKMMTDKVYHATSKINSNYRKVLRGGDISRYINNWDGRRWIKYGKNLAGPRKESIFNAPKLIVRQTGDHLVATYDDQHFITLNNTHVINQKADYDLKYILALFNSKLMTFYFRYLNPETDEVLAEVKKATVEKLRIKYTRDQKPFIDMVNLILEKKEGQKADQTEESENRLDVMVYKLYGLDYSEVKVVDPKFQLNEQDYESFRYE